MHVLDTTRLDYHRDSEHYFAPFADEPWSCLLDSCSSLLAGTENSRYDIITANPWATITVDHSGTIEEHNRLDSSVRHHHNSCPFETLEQLLATMTAIDCQKTPFTGGAVGFWGYELGGIIEKKVPPRVVTDPLMAIGLYHWAIVTDHHLKSTTLVCHPQIPSGQKEWLLNKIQKQSWQALRKFELTVPFQPIISAEQYQESFVAIQRHILYGDVYEVNLAQQFSAKYRGDPWCAYQRLRKASPAPFSAFIRHSDCVVMSHSPECFLTVSNNRVVTHPIKGTRPRGRTAEEDRANANALQESEKDRSENLMIVDLLRNDLGRSCKNGTVQVETFCALKTFSNVHHLVSSISGELLNDCSLTELMHRAFPGGSITGAPKISAMEIIRKLEPTPRGAYCGTVGYISSNRRMDTSIAIRTLVAKGDGSINCWGGGAIVADSDCLDEYRESVTKVRNLMETLEEQ